MTVVVNLDPPPGDKDQMVAGSDAIGAAESDLTPMVEAAQHAFATGLETWTGTGSRRMLFQHAATGIQAELTTLISAVSSASELIEGYLNALAVTNGHMDDLDTFWTGKQLEVYSNPGDPSIQAEVDKAGHETEHSADLLRSHMHQLAHLLAADLDKITNLLVAGGSTLSPDAIARKVTSELGVDYGSTMTTAAMNKLLGIAAKAAPPGASEPDGSLDIEKFLRSLNDQVVSGTALGGEGWALVNLLRYRITATELARRTEELYASIVGTSLAELQAGRITSTEHVGGILRFLAAEDELGTDVSDTNAGLVRDVLKGGGWTRNAGVLLGVLGIVGDLTTLNNLDEIENTHERKAVQIAAIANALGLSEATLSTLLAANAGDEVPGWGEVVATATGVFLAGDYAYHEGPHLASEVKDNIIESLQGWVTSWAQYH